MDPTPGLGQSGERLRRCFVLLGRSVFPRDVVRLAAVEVVASGSLLLLRGWVDVGAVFAGAERATVLGTEAGAAGVRTLLGA